MPRSIAGSRDGVQRGCRSTTSNCRPCWSNGLERQGKGDGHRCDAPPKVRFATDLYGAFPVKRLLLGLPTVLCSERERPFFIPSPAIQFPERAEGVKGPKR